jgi:hypothetical protein
LKEADNPNANAYVGHVTRNCGWLIGSESEPWMTASKKTDTSLLRPQANEFCQHLMILEDLELRMKIAAMASYSISPWFRPRAEDLINLFPHS